MFLLIVLNTLPFVIFRNLGALGWATGPDGWTGRLDWPAGRAGWAGRLNWPAGRAGIGPALA
jgi:hypothetical protein